MSAERSPQASMNAGTCGNVPASPRGINTSGINPANSPNGATNMDNGSAMIVHHILDDPVFNGLMANLTKAKVMSLCRQMLIPKIITMSQEHADSFIQAELLKMMQDMAISGILPGAVNCTCSESRRNRGVQDDTQNTNLSLDKSGALSLAGELEKDKCYICRQYFSREPDEILVQCTECQAYYHEACVDIKEDPFVCDFCTYNLPKDMSDRIKTIRDTTGHDFGHNESARSRAGDTLAGGGLDGAPLLNSTMNDSSESNAFPGNVSAIAPDQCPDLNICAAGFGPAPQNGGVGEAPFSEIPAQSSNTGNVAGNYSSPNNAGTLMQPNPQGAGDPRLSPMQNGGRMNEHYGCVNCGCQPDQNGQNNSPANVRGISPNHRGQNYPTANVGRGSPNQGVQNYPTANVGPGSPNQGVQNYPTANVGPGSPNQGVQNYPTANVGRGSPIQGVQNYPTANVGPGSPNQGVQNYPTANVGLGSPNRSGLNNNMANSGMPGGNTGLPLNGGDNSSVASSGMPLFPGPLGGNNSMRNGIPEGNTNTVCDRAPQNEGDQNDRSAFAKVIPPINPLTNLVINDPYFRNTMWRRCLFAPPDQFHVDMRQTAINHIPTALSKRFQEVLPKVVADIVHRGLVPMTRPCPCPPETQLRETLINNQTRQNASINSQARQNASINSQARQNASMNNQDRQNIPMDIQPLQNTSYL